MRLERLAATRFRNLHDFELHTDAQFVVLHGDNAQGKTNTLEAIWLVATLRGLRVRKHRDLVRWGDADSVVAADVKHDGIVRSFRVEVGGGQRKALLDGKAPSDLSDYFAGVRAIAFTPDDAGIVAAEPGRRRAWLDRAAFTRAPAHLEVVRSVARVLAQKSALLRQDRVDRYVLDALDQTLVHEGARLAHRRGQILGELSPHIEQLHQGIAGGGTIRLTHRTHADGDSLEAREQALAERLASVRDRELQRGTTLAGPQHDDLDIRIEDRSARTYGSRGQVRSLVLAMKLAELVAARERGQTPMFLLDDLSSELDRSRTGHLVQVLAELGTQVFVTTTAPDHIEGLPEGETLSVRVQGGTLTPAT